MRHSGAVYLKSHHFGGSRSAGTVGAVHSVSFVNGTANSTNSQTTVVVTAPASIVTGNLLVAFLHANPAVGTDFGGPTGWSLVDHSLVSSSSGNAGVMVKTATGSEPASYSFTGATNICGAVCQIAGATAADGATVYTQDPGSSTTYSVTGTTTSLANNLVFVAFGYGTQNAWTAPSGFTAGPVSETLGRSGIRVFYKVFATAGATGNFSGTNPAPTPGNNMCSAWK